LVNTWTYYLFTTITVIVYWVIPHSWRAYLLTLAGFLYFGSYYPREILLLLVTALVVYLWGLVITKRPGRWLLAAGVLLAAGNLAYFKYRPLLVETYNWFASWKGLTVNPGIHKIVVPLGISYFTFKMIHYLVDLHRGHIERHRAIDFFNYIFFFPILTAGPIERFQPFLAQSQNIYGFEMDNLYQGLPRIIVGLFKKIVLADTLAIWAVNLNSPDLTAGQYWWAMYAYTFQIYFDFSGYTDMALGVSRLFGYRIMENFDWPYLSRDVSEFWKRWHMSLTGWLRDYVFIPLGGSRGQLSTTIRNTFIVMAVTGIWHGAAWHFLAWGLYHAAGLTGLRLYRRCVYPKLSRRLRFLQFPAVVPVNVLLTFHYVAVGWIFFACNTRQSLHVIAAMLGL